MPLQNETAGTRQQAPADPFFRETNAYVEKLTSDVPPFPALLQDVIDGDAEIRLKKQFLLRAIDETWVRVIEDSLPALDKIIRNPSRFIEENDRVLPIEISRNITSRSIRHLAQHTDFISDIDEDGNITPNKILNVFHDETIMTYENKFVNTLLNRLYGFVSSRYQKALEHPEDAKRTELTFTDTFSRGDTKGKIHVLLELEEVPQEGEVLKNYTYTLDLWRRVKRIHGICLDYMNSAFVRDMDKTYIRPPVMRTNAILKNRELRQCLALWEFLEEYQNTGCNLLVEESLETVSDAYIRELYSTLSAEYLLFLHRVKSGFDKDYELAHTRHEAVLHPKVVEDLVPSGDDDFNERCVRALPREVTGDALTEDNRCLLECIEIALDASEQLYRMQQPAAEVPEVALLRRHLRRSFMAKLIQAKPFVQDAYETLKNLLLSYRKVTSRVSWSYDSFRCSRVPLAKLAIRGKTLVLYLALNPADYNAAKYHHTDSSEVKKYAETPFTLRIRSARAIKYGSQLIAELMQKRGILQGELPQVDYHLPFETTRALYDRDLIRGDGKIPDEELELLLRNSGNLLDAEDAEEEPGSFGGIRYQRAFLARLIQSGDTVQKSYTALKNRLLSYRKIHSRISWDGDSFRFGRRRLFRLSIRGKTLVLNLALDPAAYPVSKYHPVDCSEIKRFADVPMRLKIRSDRAVKYALELIDETMQRFEVPVGDVHEADYTLPYEDTEHLILRGLIRRIDKQHPAEKPEDAGASEAEAVAAMRTVSDADEAEEASALSATVGTEEASALPAAEIPATEVPAAEVPAAEGAMGEVSEAEASGAEASAIAEKESEAAEAVLTDAAAPAEGADGITAGITDDTSERSAAEAVSAEEALQDVPEKSGETDAAAEEGLPVSASSGETDGSDRPETLDDETSDADASSDTEDSDSDVAKVGMTNNDTANAVAADTAVADLSAPGKEKNPLLRRLQSWFRGKKDK